MESLFDKNECYTEKANELAREVHNVISPIVKRYSKLGYSTREIEAIVECEAQMVILCERLGRQHDNFKKSKVKKVMDEKNNF